MVWKNAEVDGTDLAFELRSQCPLRHCPQVMEEGEKLSKKQVELEGIIKRLRQQLGGLEGERDKLAGRLATEEGAVAELKKAKAKLEKDLVLAGGNRAARRRWRNSAALSLITGWCSVTWGR